MVQSARQRLRMLSSNGTSLSMMTFHLVPCTHCTMASLTFSRVESPPCQIVRLHCMAFLTLKSVSLLKWQPHLNHNTNQNINLKIINRMKKQPKLQNVVDSLKGRFVSLLVKKGEQRRAFSAKINGVTSRHVMFSDMNGGNRRVSRRHILRATCADKTFKRSVC